MNTRIIKVGIISRDAYRRRTIAIARGEYKPKKDEPKVWIESPDVHEEEMLHLDAGESRTLVASLSEPFRPTISWLRCYGATMRKTCSTLRGGSETNRDGGNETNLNQRSRRTGFAVTPR